MAITTTILAKNYSGNLFKVFMIGAVAAAGLGFIASSAKADEIIQTGVQTSIQEGNGNTSVQQLDQNAESIDTNRSYYRSGNWYDNNDVIQQNADQFSRQRGDRNTSVQQLNQDANVFEGRRFRRW